MQSTVLGTYTRQLSTHYPYFKPWEVMNGSIIFKEVIGICFERLRIWVSVFKTHKQDDKLQGDQWLLEEETVSSKNKVLYSLYIFKWSALDTCPYVHH